MLLERRRWEEDGGGSYVVSKELNEQQRSNSVRREVMKRSLHSGGSQRRARTRTANDGGKNQDGAVQLKLKPRPC